MFATQGISSLSTTCKTLFKNCYSRDKKFNERVLLHTLFFHSYIMAVIAVLLVTH